MRGQHGAMILLRVALAAAAAASCRADSARSEDQPPTAGILSDEEVVKVMREPKVPGRIIYDPPPDLSYASARLRRPDLVPSDTSERRD